MEIIGKISLKGIGAQPAANSVHEPRELASIYGAARQFVTGVTTYGDYTKFKGDFEAVNLGTGEAFKSSALILPEIVETMLINALLAEGAKAGKAKTANAAEQAGTDAQAPVEFAFTIGVRPTTNKEGSGRGYEFTVKPLQEFSGADAIAHLRDRVKAIGHEKPHAETNHNESASPKPRTARPKGK